MSSLYVASAYESVDCIDEAIALNERVVENHEDMFGPSTGA
jgi:hypothetical protein